MECPKCGLFNPDNALRCDCGYDFESREVVGSLVHEKKKLNSKKKPKLINLLIFLFILTLGSGLGLYNTHTSLKALRKELNRITYDEDYVFEKFRQNRSELGDLLDSTPPNYMQDVSKELWIEDLKDKILIKDYQKTFLSILTVILLMLDFVVLIKINKKSSR